MRPRLLPVCVAMLVLSALAAAQTTPDRNPQAMSTIGKSLAALAQGNLSAVLTDQEPLTASGTYTQFTSDGEQTFPLTVEAIGARNIRWDVQREDGQVTTVVQGPTGWIRDPKGTTTLSVSQLPGRGAEALPLLLLADWYSSTQVAFQPPDTQHIKGHTFTHVVTWRSPAAAASLPGFPSAYKKMTRCEVYLDPVTFMPMRLRYYAHPKDWRINIPVDIVFSSFKRTGGVVFPTTVTRYVQGQKEGEIQFSTVSLGATVNPDDFTRR